MGGFTGEREVSLQSGQAVVEALAETGDHVVALQVDDERKIYQTLAHAHLDVAFLTLHGRLGEDGCVQGLLELLQIPYTGSSVVSSALAMDKIKSKELFRLHNLPTPPYYQLHREQTLDLEEVHGTFGFPVVVKPRREGSSLGVSKADNLKQLAKAVAEAFEYDDWLLVERYIQGTEVAVGLLDGRVLGAIEIEPAAGLYDYAAKYNSATTRYHLPARLPEGRYKSVLNLAARAASALDCSGPVRVDLIVSEGQNEYLLEVNTLPGMARQGPMARIAQAAGYSYVEFCEAILAGARLHSSVLLRHRDAPSQVVRRENGAPPPRLGQTETPTLEARRVVPMRAVG